MSATSAQDIREPRACLPPRRSRYRWISGVPHLIRYLRDNGITDTLAQVLKDNGPRYVLCRLWSSEPVRVYFTVEGQITLSECRLLYRLAAQVREGAIAEIGSFRGLSTLCLALGARKAPGRPRVYAIDPHSQFTGVLGYTYVPEDKDRFIENVARFHAEEDITLVSCGSAEALKGWSDPISLLWIDGDHRFEAVKADFLGWEPFLMRTGVVVLHDSRNPYLGPARIVRELLVDSKRFSKPRHVCTTTYAKKLAY